MDLAATEDLNALNGNEVARVRGLGGQVHQGRVVGRRAHMQPTRALGDWDLRVSRTCTILKYSFFWGGDVCYLFWSLSCSGYLGPK